MLIKHGAYYLLAKGLPGIISFVAVTVYTRILTPEQYGEYSLTVVAAAGAGLFLYQWQRRVVSRWLPANAVEGRGRQYLGEVAFVFIVLTLLATALAVVLWTIPVSTSWTKWIWPVLVLLIINSLFELHLTIASAQLKAMAYGKMLGTKVVLSLLFGVVLIHSGLGAAGAIYGLVLGCVAALVLWGRGYWHGVRLLVPDRADTKAGISYGIPIAFTLALTWIVESSDRLMIAALVDTDAVGQYSVGYDLAAYTLVMALSIISIPAFALVVNVLEQSGEKNAQLPLRHNGEFIVSIALSGAAVISILAPSASVVVVGSEFQENARALLPVVALGAAIGGVKTFHFDLAFHLGKKTRHLFTSVAIAAVLNVCLNLALIPHWEIMGAAWATVISLMVGALASALLGRRVFVMPSFGSILKRALLLSIAAGSAAFLGQRFVGIGFAGLLCGAMFAGLAAILAAILLNIGGARSVLSKFDRAV